MSRILPLFSLIAAAVLVAQSGQCAPAGAAQKKKPFESIEAIIASHGVTATTPGVGVCLIPAKGPPRTVIVGKADIEEKQDIKSNTVFELASCSKPFTATAILLLHDQGKLSIDDPVRKHIPELPNYQKGKTLTIRHLLHHTGGLPDYFDLDWPSPKGRKFIVNEDLVPEFAAQRAKHPAPFAPGDKYEYSNTGFALLSVIVARVSKQPFGEFMHEHLFVPLKMSHTFVLDRPGGWKLAKDPAPKAVAYEFDKKKQAWVASWGAPPRRHEENLVVGDGGVWTSLDDMQKWDKNVRERGLLKPETWAMALTPSVTADKKTNDYGLGWGLDLGDKNKLMGFGHGGSWSGFKTEYHLDLAKNRSVIVLSNRGGFDTDKFADQVFEWADRNP